MNCSDSLSISSRDNKVHTETDEGFGRPKTNVSFVLRLCKFKLNDWDGSEVNLTFDIYKKIAG